MRTIPRNRSTRRKRWPRAFVAVAHCVLAFAVLFGIVHAGGRYFYCDALGLLPSDPCVETATDGPGKSPLGLLRERHADCCETVILAAMPRAAQPAAPSVAPAARVAILPAVRFAGKNDSAEPSGAHRAPERWRPPPRASNDRRAERMVFLI